MKSVSILSVHYDEQRELFEVVKQIVHDDNRVDLNLHVFYATTLEWRAAEYDIDDIDLAIDIVLYEPFTEPVDILGSEAPTKCTQHLSEVQARKALRVPAGASQAVRASLANAGVAKKFIDGVTEDPYAVIRSHAAFDHEVIAVRRAFVDKVRKQSVVREQHKREQEGKMKVRTAGAVRAHRERERLFRQENMRREGVAPWARNTTTTQD